MANIDAKMVMDELRPAEDVIMAIDIALREDEMTGQGYTNGDAVRVLIADREAVRAPLLAEIERLRDLLVRGYVVCDGDDEDAVAFRNDAHAALAGDSHDQ